MTTWTFLSNHGRALLCIARDPEIRLRDIAGALGITERRAYDIVNDLAAAGYVIKERDGRRNRYQVQEHLPIPEDPDQAQAIGEVLKLLVRSAARDDPLAAEPAGDWCAMYPPIRCFLAWPERHGRVWERM